MLDKRISLWSLVLTHKLMIGRMIFYDSFKFLKLKVETVPSFLYKTLSVTFLLQSVIPEERSLLVHRHCTALIQGSIFSNSFLYSLFVK